MIRYGIWVTFLLSVELSSVLGSRNQYYEYYYNKYHHKSHSTTTALSSSKAETSTDHKISLPVSETSMDHKINLAVSGDDDSLESAEHSSTVDFELTKHKNRTSHSYGYSNRNNGASTAWLIAGIIIFLLCALGFVIFYCCCRKGCRRENKGFVLSNNDPEPTRLLSENSILNQAILPDYTNEPPQQYPPYYQSGPLMPPYYCPVPTMYQHSPVSQMQPQGVPATPPPPYEAPSYEAPPLRN